MGCQKDIIVISEADNDIFESTVAEADHVIEIVLENILFFLTSRLDRNAASLVCKLWYRVEALTRSEVFIGNCYAVSPRRTVERFLNVNSVILKGKPRFADFNMLPFDWGAHFTPWVNSFSVAYSWLQKFYLKRMTITNEDLSLLARSFSAMQELVFVCCDGFGTSGLALVANKCRKLRVFDMVDDDVSDDDVDWVSCFPEDETCLESLVFDCVESLVPFDSLERLVARSPMLKKLKLNRHVLMGELNRLMIRAPQLTHLGTGSFGALDAISLDVLTEYTSAFNASKSLECLSGFREMDPVFLPALHPVCSNLTSLNFSCASISFLQLKPIISQCHKLRTFWALDSVCDEGLQAVASTCRDLRELRIFPIEAREDFEVSVSEVGLQSISEGCRNLESVLYFCQRMTNSALIQVSNNCPRLSVFRLCIMGRHRPDCVTGEPMDEGFGSIVRRCRSLTRLALSGLLTDRAFFYIGSHGRSLRTLSVAFAGNTDVSMIYILEGCHNLQKLEIRDSPFGDTALLSVIHRFYNMRFLWMSSSRSTIEGCQDVARALPRLVVEVIDQGETDPVHGCFQILYLYRSLEGPRDDLPTSVTIL